MSEIINISGIECYEKNGTAYPKLETMTRGLGFTKTEEKMEPNTRPFAGSGDKIMRDGQ